MAKRRNPQAVSLLLADDTEVDNTNPLPVTVSGAGAGGVSQVDNTAFTPGTDSGTPAEGLYEAAPSSITDGRVGVAGITAKRAWRVVLETAAAVALLGQKADAASLPVTLSTEGTAQVGGLTETAPATDTASSGLNGRLQRIAQRLTSIIALLPTALGAGGGLKVDGSGTALPVSLASVPSHAVTNAGTFAVQAAEADGANVTLGAKADAKSTATDTTAVSAMQVLKQISASVQAPPSQAVTNAGTFAVQAAEADGANVAIGALADAVVAAGATGSVSAKLRRVTQGLEDLKTLIVLAAGTALIGRVSSSDETSTIYSAATALTPKFAKIVASSSGATTIVALVSNKKLRVISMDVVANAAVNVKWQSHVTPTDLTGLAYCAANGGYILPYNPTGWFETISGEALDINLSGNIAVGGHLSYIEV